MDEEPVSSKNKCQKEENRMYSLKPILKQYCIKIGKEKKWNARYDYFASHGKLFVTLQAI